MNWRHIPRNIVNALRPNKDSSKETKVTERNGKTLAYTLLIPISDAATNNTGKIKSLILLNPWSALDQPQISFESQEGKPFVRIAFHTYSEEKGKIIENELRKIVSNE